MQLHSVSFCMEWTFANWLFDLTLQIRKYFMRFWTSFYLSRDLQLSFPTSKESVTSIIARHWAQWEHSCSSSGTDPMQYTQHKLSHDKSDSALRWPVGKALAAAHMWRLSVILETHVKVKDKKQLHEIVLWPRHGDSGTHVPNTISNK